MQLSRLEQRYSQQTPPSVLQSARDEQHTLRTVGQQLSEVSRANAELQDERPKLLDARTEQASLIKRQRSEAFRLQGDYRNVIAECSAHQESLEHQCHELSEMEIERGILMPQHLEKQDEWAELRAQLLGAERTQVKFDSLLGSAWAEVAEARAGVVGSGQHLARCVSQRRWSAEQYEEQ